MTSRNSGLLIGILSFLVLFGCAKPEMHDPLLGEKLSRERSAPMGGDALAERQREMRRASEDLFRFHATLVNLRSRQDARGHRHFKKFVDTYMSDHLNPILDVEWSSDHPALAGIDANLRVAKAALLVQMGEPYRVQPVIDELARRFLGRNRVLVTYPSGERVTIKRAIEILQNKKWRVGRLET